MIHTVFQASVLAKPLLLPPPSALSAWRSLMRAGITMGPMASGALQVLGSRHLTPSGGWRPDWDWNAFDRDQWRAAFPALALVVCDSVGHWTEQQIANAGSERGGPPPKAMGQGHVSCSGMCAAQRPNMCGTDFGQCSGPRAIRGRHLSIDAAIGSESSGAVASQTQRTGPTDTSRGACCNRRLDTVGSGLRGSACEGPISAPHWSSLLARARARARSQAVGSGSTVCIPVGANGSPGHSSPPTQAVIARQPSFQALRPAAWGGHWRRDGACLRRPTSNATESS